jgi:hypothetical protein
LPLFIPPFAQFYTKKLFFSIVGGEFFFKNFRPPKKTRVFWQKSAQFFFSANKSLLMGTRDVVLAETKNAIYGGIN